MHPILFKFWKITIYTYGFFVALAFMVAISVAKYEARRLGENDEKIMDLAFWVLIAAIAGARFFYILMAPETFLRDPLEIFRLWNGGLVFYGGFIVALIASALYLKKNRMPLWRTADIVAPALAIGHAIGRIGCFCAGCCYGKTCDLPWAVIFRDAHSLAPVHIPLHPTQLYAVLANTLIFVFLMLFRRYKSFEGQLFLLYVMIYGITRSLLETLRGDFRGDRIFGILSVSQFIGLSLAVLAAVMLLVLGKHSIKKTHLDRHA